MRPARASANAAERHSKPGLIISMEDGEKLSLEQIRAFVEAGGGVRFQAHNRLELYEWANQALRLQDYGRLRREGRGLVRRYLAKMTG